jgi:17beta-estradiol 17-dehydrogenase / very-long-chain 3-oxoacyl-CoA reductase
MYYDEVPDSMRHDMLSTNVVSAVEMARIVMPGMKLRKRGAIVFVASAASRLPIGSPLLALYAASKAAVSTLARSLAGELRASRVSVHVQSPYFVQTKMAKIKRASFFVPTPRSYAAAAVAGLGGADDQVPYWPHALQDAALKSLPEFLQERVIVNLHKDIRARAIKKAAREAKTN